MQQTVMSFIKMLTAGGEVEACTDISETVRTPSSLDSFELFVFFKTLASEACVCTEKKKHYIEAEKATLPSNNQSF